MSDRRSIEIPTLSHQNPLPVASRIGPLLVSSVISSFDPGTRTVPESIEQQIENVFTHVEAILAAGGATLDDVAKMTFFVTDISIREKLNEPWIKRFPDADRRPARHTQLVPGKAPSVSCDFLAYVS
jgi:2-iminobutanoate/2-iminopropanoate deaminase